MYVFLYMLNIFIFYIIFYILYNFFSMFIPLCEAGSLLEVGADLL